MHFLTTFNMLKNLIEADFRIFIMVFVVTAIMGCGTKESENKVEHHLPNNGMIINNILESHDGFSGDVLYLNKYSYVPPNGSKPEIIGESACENSNPDEVPDVAIVAKSIVFSSKCTGPALHIRSVMGTWTLINLDRNFFSNYPQWVADQTPADKEHDGYTSLIGIDQGKGEIVVEYVSTVKRKMAFRLAEGGERLVMSAFRRIPNPEYDFDSLMRQLNDKAGNYRASAAQRLGILREPRAVDSLIAVLNDKTDNVADSAAEALGRIGDQRAVIPLLTVLTRSQGHIRETAAESLGLIRDGRAVEPLIRVLLDKGHCPKLSEIKKDFLLTDGREDFLRASAAEALGNIGDPLAIEPLSTVLRTSINERWYVRRAAADALGNINDPRAIEALVSAVNVYDKNVRSSVRFALRRRTGIASPKGK